MGDEEVFDAAPTGGNPACVTCGVMLIEVGTTCGDEDDQCECDTLYDCVGCGGKFVYACPTHVNDTWKGRRTVIDPAEMGTSGPKAE